MLEDIAHARPPLCPPLREGNPPRDPRTASLARFLDEGVRALALEPPDWRAAQASYQKALEVAAAAEEKRDRAERLHQEVSKQIADIWGWKQKQPDSDKRFVFT